MIALFYGLLVTKTQFSLKGRSTIVAYVKLKDSEGDIRCEGSFKWFIQRKE